MYIIPFTSPNATLELAGGKGTNLVRLTRAGFDVPRGFIVSTNAYREFVKANKLDGVIQQQKQAQRLRGNDAMIFAEIAQLALLKQDVSSSHHLITAFAVVMDDVSFS